ncbi:MAG: hypothetical protein AAGJ82_05330, partial [Bacteroidota bacterium]
CVLSSLFYSCETDVATGQSPDELTLHAKALASEVEDEPQGLVVYIDGCENCEIRISDVSGLYMPSVFGSAVLNVGFNGTIISITYDSNGNLIATIPNGSGSTFLPSTWVQDDGSGLDPVTVSVTNIPSGSPPSFFYGNLIDQVTFDLEARCPERRNGNGQVLSYLYTSFSWTLEDNFDRVSDTSSTANDDLPLNCPEYNPVPRSRR